MEAEFWGAVIPAGKSLRIDLDEGAGEYVHVMQAWASTRSLQSSTRGPSGHSTHVRAQLEHRRHTSTD